MIREDVIKGSTTYYKAVSRLGWPCLSVSLLAMIIWMLIRSPRVDVNLILLSVIALPVVALLISLRRLQKRLHLECPHCHVFLVKPKIVQLVLETGQCPNCGVR